MVLQPLLILLDQIVRYLESAKPSRNQFIKAAIRHYREYLCGRQQESQLLEIIRLLFREEVSALPLTVEGGPASAPAVPMELTEKQREQSAAAVLVFLSSFYGTGKEEIRCRRYLSEKTRHPKRCHFLSAQIDLSLKEIMGNACVRTQALVKGFAPLKPRRQERVKPSVVFSPCL